MVNSLRCAAYAVTFLFSGLGLPGIAIAQSAAPYDTGRITRLPVELGSSAAFGRCQVGHLTPDLRPDALVRSGTGFVCVSAVETLGQLIALDPTGSATSVRDAVIAPGVERDTVMCLVDSAAGIELIEARFQYIEEGTETEDRFVTVTSTTHGAFESAQSLTVGHFDLDDDLDVFVLCGGEVVRFERTALGTLEYVATIAISGEFVGLDLAPFGSASAEDLVVWSDESVHVFSSTANSDFTFSSYQGIRSVSAWRCSTAGAGRLAIVTRQLVEAPPNEFNDVTRLYVRGVNYAEPVVSLGGLQTSDAIAADFLGIGTSSLFLLNQYGPVFVSLFNFGGPLQGSQNTFNAIDPWYNAAQAFDIDSGTYMTNQSGRSAAHDVDGDGDLDMLFTCDATGDLHVKRNPLVDEIARGPWVSKIESIYTSFPPSPNGFGQYFRVELTASSIPADSTHVQMSIYQMHTDSYLPTLSTQSLRFVGGELFAVSALEATSATDLMTPSTQLLGAEAAYMRDYNGPAYAYGETADYVLLARALRETNGTFSVNGPELIYKFGHTRQNSDADMEPDIGTPDPIEPEPLPPPPRRVPPSTP